MVGGLSALPVQIFPDPPRRRARRTLWRDSSCQCALDGINQVLAAGGVDVDAARPCIKPWFVRYPMADGGLNCDETAY